VILVTSAGTVPAQAACFMPITLFLAGQAVVILSSLRACLLQRVTVCNWRRSGGKICRRESHRTRAAWHPRSGCASHNDAVLISTHVCPTTSPVSAWAARRLPAT